MRSATVNASTSSFLPIPVAEFELSDPERVARPNAAGQIHLLVRVHGVPLGTLVLLEPGNYEPEDIVALVSSRFEGLLTEHLERDQALHDEPFSDANAASDLRCSHWPEPSSQLVTVIVCTLGQEPRLGQAIGSILAQTHRDLELVVVDNDPQSGRTAAALAEIADPRLRLIAEPRRGLSVARNTGVEFAQGRVVAFTDDDAIADPRWLEALISPFGRHRDIACVTGLVLPAELATQEQVWFEEFGAFDKGFSRLVWSTRDDIPGLSGVGPAGERGALFPYSCGVFGSGNNMAFRTEFLRSHGLFDVALGAGTRARGGEDLDAFLITMLSDGVIVYEPQALVKHFARSDRAALRRQMYGYGAGMCAVVAKHTFAGPRSALRVAVRIPAGARKLLDPGSDKNENRTKTFPKELVRAELAGYVAGPWLYFRSRRTARRLGLYEPAKRG